MGDFWREIRTQLLEVDYNMIGEFLRRENRDDNLFQIIIYYRYWQKNTIVVQVMTSKN